MMTNLNKNLNRMNKYQQQMQSGKKFSLPSDDPIAASKSIKLYTDQSKIEQYKTNIRDAKSWILSTEDSVAHIGEVLSRTRDLMTQAANGTNSEDETRAIAAEVRQLRDQLIHVANSAHAGRTLFTGYKTNKKLLDADGNYVIGLTSNGPDQEVSRYNVGVAEHIEVNTVGIRLFGKGDDPTNFDFGAVDVTAGEKSSVIEFFDQLIINLENEETEIVGQKLDDIDEIIKNTLNIRAELGAKVNRLDLTLNRIESDALNQKRLLSENEDADIAEVIMNMKMAESVYLSSMAVGTRIIQPTLVDFLR